jgi:hypothetical protein
MRANECQRGSGVRASCRLIESAARCRASDFEEPLRRDLLGIDRLTVNGFSTADETEASLVPAPIAATGAHPKMP